MYRGEESPRYEVKPLKKLLNYDGSESGNRLSGMQRKYSI